MWPLFLVLQLLLPLSLLVLVSLAAPESVSASVDPAACVRAVSAAALVGRVNVFVKGRALRLREQQQQQQQQQQQPQPQPQPQQQQQQQQQHQQHHRKYISKSNWKNYRHNHQHQHQHNYHQHYHQHYHRPCTTAGVAAAFCFRSERISRRRRSSKSQSDSRSDSQSDGQSPLILFASTPRSTRTSTSTSTRTKAEKGNGSGSGSPVDGPGPGPTKRSSPVWFLLVDEKGNAFKGAGIDFVERSNASFVAKFRDAVIQKFSRNRLKDVDPVDLQVYANKAAFKTEEMEKQKRLKSSDSLVGLGINEDDAIYVMVPSLAASTSTSLGQIEALARAQSFYDSIMQPIKEIPNSNGMRVMEAVVKLDTGETRDIVLRSIAEPFWKQCLDIVDSNKDNIRTRVCAVGTPGTGKSSIIPYLIRLILEKKDDSNTVVFINRSPELASWYYEFSQVNVLGEKRVNIKVYAEKMDRIDIPSLKERNTYYIVDPGMTKDSCNPWELFLPKTIIVSSPDERHWGGNEFDKFRDALIGKFLYFPTWSVEKLIAARNVLKPDLSETQVLERFRQFGGMPRRVITADPASFIDAQEFAINGLTVEQVVKIARRAFGAVITCDADQPKSAVIGFVASTTCKNFERPEVNVISDIVAEKIYTNYIRNLWQTMLDLKGAGWTIFEPYTRQLMLQKKEIYTARFCVGKSSKERKNHDKLQLGGCKRIQLSVNVVSDARKTPYVVFHSISSQNKLFDFMYYDKKTKVFHAFQVTTGLTHTANRTNISQLRASIAKDQKLCLYYLVPSDRFEAFTTNPVEPVLLNEMVSRQLEVYHVMVPDPNQQQEAAPKPKRGRQLKRKKTPVDEAIGDEVEPRPPVALAPAQKTKPRKIRAKSSPKGQPKSPRKISDTPTL